MYDNGLQDTELQEYHKEVKFSINLFLEDILDGTFSSFFYTVTRNGLIYIYPLFYTDTILIDSDDGVVNSPYCVIVPVGFNGLISFYGDDGQIVESKRLYLSDVDGYVTVMVYNAKTREFIPEQEYLVEYQHYPAEHLFTGRNGYGGFIRKESGYNVVIL